MSDTLSLSTIIEIYMLVFEDVEPCILDIESLFINFLKRLPNLELKIEMKHDVQQHDCRASMSTKPNTLV
jgi:hypothetical protein